MSDVNLDAVADANAAAELLVRISFVFLKGGSQKNNFEYTNKIPEIADRSKDKKLKKQLPGDNNP